MNIDFVEYFGEEGIKQLIEEAPTLQKKTFLACMYESCARPEEFLRFTNLDKNQILKELSLFSKGIRGKKS